MKSKAQTSRQPEFVTLKYEVDGPAADDHVESAGKAQRGVERNG